jgi:hypothetical protein
LQRALAQESRSKDVKDSYKTKTDRSRMHLIDYNSSSDDEVDVYAAEFVWPSKAKPYACNSLKPIRKNREEEIKFTFDIGKCDKIFYALLQDKIIKIAHTLPPFEELKRRAYCKYHNSFSHATNDCNVFRRQIQSAINDGRLSFAEMQVDKTPFPMNTLDLEGKKVLLRPEQAEAAKGKSYIVIGEPRVIATDDKVLGKRVMVEKAPDGKETLKITIPGGQVQQRSHAKFIKPKSPEVGKWKVNEAKVLQKKVKPTFDMLLSKYAKQVADSSSNRALQLKRPRSPPRHQFQHQHGPCRPHAPALWMVPSPNVPYYARNYYGGWEQPRMAPYTFHPGWAAPRRSVFERLTHSTKGHLDSGINRPSQASPKKKIMKQEWRRKSSHAEVSESASKKEERSTRANIIKIGAEDIQTKELGKGPIIVDNPAKSGGVVAAVQPISAANNHEASTSSTKKIDPKYTQPRWCPLGLSKTKKRRLQRMRTQQKEEEKSEKYRDEFFNLFRPVINPKQVWKPKIDEKTATPPPVPAAVTPILEVSEAISTLPMSPTTSPSSQTSIFTLGDDEEMVDFEPTPSTEGMDINMVYYLPAEYRAVDEEREVAQLDFGPKNAIFEKHKEPVKHLKPLYIKGHINGSPVARMLVDGGAVINLMPYSVFKRLGLRDEDLKKTNMVLNGIEGKEPTESKGVIYVELTVGSKTLSTAFFVAEIFGNYNVILGRDWVHANQCVPSTMHQFLI